MRRTCPAIDRWFVRWCGVNFVSILTLYTTSIIDHSGGYSMRRYNIEVVVIIIIIPFGMGGGPAAGC